jgi:hypothetical protein
MLLVVITRHETDHNIARITNVAQATARLDRLLQGSADLGHGLCARDRPLTAGLAGCSSDGHGRGHRSQANCTNAGCGCGPGTTSRPQDPRRRLAALAAAGVLIWLLSGLPGQGVSLAMGNAYLFLAVGVEILALTASPGPRRGLQILTWKHGAFTVIATVLAGTDVLPMT